MHTLTRSELTELSRDPSPEIRASAFQSLLGVHEAHGRELAQIYKYIVADWHDENVGLRGMPSSISVRNVENDVPDDVVATLLEACRENVGLFQRYFELKAKWLDLETLRRSDI